MFFYAWIASQDQIFIAEVINNGDGTLNATYESAFPGEYLVHVEAVVLNNRDEGVPVKGSPFSLTITGNPSIDIDALPTCGIEGRDAADYFWNTGTWVSSNIASAKHGVTRDGWVFQPKTCVHDTFSYDDLMLLASLSEPTWLLVLGGSVQRGLYLTLVDMILAQGQKDDFGTSAIQKCWGYADITVGRLRVTYQVGCITRVLFCLYKRGLRSFLYVGNLLMADFDPFCFHRTRWGRRTCASGWWTKRKNPWNATTRNSSVGVLLRTFARRRISSRRWCSKKTNSGQMSSLPLSFLRATTNHLTPLSRYAKASDLIYVKHDFRSY